MDHAGAGGYRPFPADRASGCPFDPPPEYRELRAEEPVSRASCPAGVDAWVVSRYEDVRTALSDPRLSSRAAPLVPYTHAQLFAEACQKADVPVQFELFPSGRHGLGLAFEQTNEVRGWTDLALGWLRGQWGEF